MADTPIGKLQASLAAATNEVTLAAANLNFDFCLVKYEAPKEYQQLGSLLSTRRKTDAETGKSHVTARRLAALFAGVCPDTPKLVAAYGQRVSEISQLATDKASKDYSSSIFGAYTGVDATSIWAAATSTKDVKGGAIHVHLLACILNIWEPGEATSIWVELVEERRRVIARDLENGVPIPFALAAAAAQQEITRADLANWDRSARSWVETANNTMLKRHTQLKLILGNISLPIGKVESVYPSVIEAWRSALMIMERLLSGIPQEVHDGTALLGLSYWHLYPDILVFGQKTVEVRMEDDILPPGGVLSLGCSPSSNIPGNGLSWSLSFAHMRYYGHPVRKKTSIQEDPSRITASEFSQVVLGCLMENWKIERRKEAAALACLYDLSKYYLEGRCIWPDLTGNYNAYEAHNTTAAAFAFLQDASMKLMGNRETGNQLLALGRKRANFMSATTKDPEIERRIKSFFGLTQPAMFLRFLNSHEERIGFLRHIGGRISKLKDLSPSAIIRYSQITSEQGPAGLLREFATLFPSDPQSYEDSTIGPSAGRQHTRWVENLSFARSFTHGPRPERVVKNEYFSTDNSDTFFTITSSGSKIKYRCLYGDPLQAGIFVADTVFEEIRYQIQAALSQVNVEDIHWAINHKLIRSIDYGDYFNDSMVRTLAVTYKWVQTALYVGEIM